MVSISLIAFAAASTKLYLVATLPLRCKIAPVCHEIAMPSARNDREERLAAMMAASGPSFSSCCIIP